MAAVKEPILTLLIEDSASYSRWLSDKLQADPVYDFQIVHATHFRTAVMLLERHAFDLVLLDLVLPNGQGADLVRRVRALAPIGALVVITALTDPDIEREAIEAHADLFIAKGKYSVDEKLTMIDGVVRQKQTERDALPAKLAIETWKRECEEIERNPHLPPFEVGAKR